MNDNYSAFPSIDNDSATLFDIPNATGSPERRLLLAVLERAILDYVGNDERELEEAKEWIFDPEATGKDRFSFIWVCEGLDLDSKSIRRKIFDMPKRGASRIAPWYLNKQAAAGV